MEAVPDNVRAIRNGTNAPHTAFVLGGGGNLGAIQVGMLEALVTRGFRPDVVIGCSVGALNGACIAADPTILGVNRLREVWLDPFTHQVLSAKKLAGPWLLLRKARSMIGNERLRTVIESASRVREFGDLAVPLHVVATSMTTGRARWFDEGPLVEPILASAAIPAVFPPVEIDGDVLVDGGVVDNVPISRAIELGAQRIVVLHVGNFDRPRPTPQRPLDVLLQSFSIARNERFARETAVGIPGVEVLVLPAIDPGPVRRDDFSQTGALMSKARVAASAWLDGNLAEASGR